MPGLMKRLFSSSSGTSKSGRKGSVSSGDAVAASQPNKGIEAPESNAAKQIPSLKTQPEGVEGAAPSVYSPLGDPHTTEIHIIQRGRRPSEVRFEKIGIEPQQNQPGKLPSQSMAGIPQNEGEHNLTQSEGRVLEESLRSRVETIQQSAATTVVDTQGVHEERIVSKTLPLMKEPPIVAAAVPPLSEPVMLTQQLREEVIHASESAAISGRKPDFILKWAPNPQSNEVDVHFLAVQSFATSIHPHESLKKVRQISGELQLMSLPMSHSEQETILSIAQQKFRDVQLAMKMYREKDAEEGRLREELSLLATKLQYGQEKSFSSEPQSDVNAALRDCQEIMSQLSTKLAYSDSADPFDPVFAQHAFPTKQYDELKFSSKRMEG